MLLILIPTIVLILNMNFSLYLIIFLVVTPILVRMIIFTLTYILILKLTLVPDLVLVARFRVRFGESLSGREAVELACFSTMRVNFNHPGECRR